MSLPVNMSCKENISHAISTCVSRVAGFLFCIRTTFVSFQSGIPLFSEELRDNQTKGSIFSENHYFQGSKPVPLYVNTTKISGALLCCNSWESAINVHMHQTILDQIFDLEEVTKPIVPSVFIIIHFRILFTFLCTKISNCMHLN